MANIESDGGINACGKRGGAGKRVVGHGPGTGDADLEVAG